MSIESCKYCDADLFGDWLTSKDGEFCNNTCALLWKQDMQIEALQRRVEEFQWANFVSYLIDHCEGDTITEERLQHALSDMIATKYCPSMPVEHHEAELKGVVVNNNLASNQILLAHPPHTTIPVGTVMIACPHPDVAHDCCVVCGKNIMPNKPDFEWDADLSSPPLDDGMVRVPVEPTEAMIEAINSAMELKFKDRNIKKQYRAEIAWSSALAASKGK